MTFLLLIPLALPFATAPLGRRALRHLAPATALWLVAGATVVLACCSLTALGAFVLTGLLKLPLFAAFGELVRPLRTPSNLVVVPAAAFSVGALAVSLWAVCRTVALQARAFRAATSEADRRSTAGDLCVIDSPRPDAYALPGRPHRIVVTTGMLRSLNPAEREALFAHERAHNAAGHHYFLAVAELAALCHPGLRPTGAVIRLAAERAADEAAAVVVGNRRLTAQAIGRAALAARAAQGERPSFAPAATTGPVPQRVAALLAAPRAPHRTARWIAALLIACAAVSACASAAGIIGFHHAVEVAQGEEGH
ncbi:M48 family metalloprotease [Streptomyces gibsoniae]|uniref:M48 family metalloprotease n=1 Tax=Streptomyces gibsoniae TaxID=3075529 RepID=A0ABU2TS17_9ACTN|nr:M48 family metalloprotease [Streptomyces sp. DSM 41699]MDT0463753.1 M48 family metalloprotease [Streptomyces sp. DSM 41699]